MKSFFKVLYKYWLGFARLLAKIQTTILLFLIYFLGVGVMALIAFILRRDLLNKRFADKESFWVERLPDTTDPEGCKKQF